MVLHHSNCSQNDLYIGHMLEMTHKFFNEKSMLPLTFTTQYLYENNQEPLNYGPWNSSQDWLSNYMIFHVLCISYILQIISIHVLYSLEIFEFENVKWGWEF